MFRKPSIQALPAAAAAAVRCFLLGLKPTAGLLGISPQCRFANFGKRNRGKQEFQTFGSSGCDTLRDLGNCGGVAWGAAWKNFPSLCVFAVESPLNPSRSLNPKSRKARTPTPTNRCSHQILIVRKRTIQFIASSPHICPSCFIQQLGEFWTRTHTYIYIDR